MHIMLQTHVHFFIEYITTHYLHKSADYSIIYAALFKKWTESCINARSALLLQKFSVLFSVDTSINRKNIRFTSHHLIFISFQQKKIDHCQSYKRRIISTFDFVEKHMTSQYSFSVDAKINSSFNQSERYVITVINIK